MMYVCIYYDLLSKTFINEKVVNKINNESFKMLLYIASVLQNLTISFFAEYNDLAFLTDTGAMFHNFAASLMKLSFALYIFVSILL